MLQRHIVMNKPNEIFVVIQTRTVQDYVVGGYADTETEYKDICGFFYDEETADRAVKSLKKKSSDIPENERHYKWIEYSWEKISLGV